MKPILATLAVLCLNLGFAQNIDMSIFENMKARSIGPAGMSGRVTCIDVIHDQPNTIYIGAASGGVWRSTSGGTDWEPIADTLPTINIGALAIQQSNPSVIWVGTGEGNPRNSQNSGYGLYRTRDAGRTWELMGLEETRNIHRVIIHPNDPNTIWVGAQGPAWGDNQNRGVYKTTDGGKTWRHVLKGNASTGIADLILDPSNPDKLMASMWDFRRQPWTFRSGGEGSGLYVSYDGGESWDEKTVSDGLPKGELGRIGLAIAPSDPNRVYAKIEAKSNDLYRSDDGGHSWYKASSDKLSGDRPFYYSDLFVDPENENRVYSLWSQVSKSEDGGKTWKALTSYWGGVHPDHHAFFVHPSDPNYIILGNDGGLNISKDRGVSWRFVQNLPLGQFYHINIDNEMPYNVYGGMQDNGSWRGPAYKMGGSIRNYDFTFLMGGDGFDVVPVPGEADRYGYAMSQEGYLGRYDLLTGRNTGIRPTTRDSIPLRFSWNAALAQDPFDANSIYFGAQYVFKSTDRGDNWIQISPDLTSNDTLKQKQIESGGLTLDVTGAENHTTLLCIEPSALDRNVIWTGSDDGRVHLTTDGGKTWTSVEEKIKGMPEGAWVPQIHASRFNSMEAFVVVNDYRRNDWAPYLFHTENGGKSWKRLASAEDFPGYCLSVVQDPVEPNLIFLGTEQGLYVSFDKGENWSHWNHGYPNVCTMDLKIQERESDLVIGTFGRSAYVLDNIAPLRAFCQASQEKWNEAKLTAFDVPTTYHGIRSKPQGYYFLPDGFKGQNRSGAARIPVYYHKDWKDDLLEADRKTEGKMIITNAAGDTIRNKKIELREGMNTLYWGKEKKGIRMASRNKAKKDAGEPGGVQVMAGAYAVTIECDSVVVTQSLEVAMDERNGMTMEDFQLRDEYLTEAESLALELKELVDEIHEKQDVLKKVKAVLPDDAEGEMKELVKLHKTMSDTMSTFITQIFGKKESKGITSDPDRIAPKVNSPYYDIAYSSGPINVQRYENKYAVGRAAMDDLSGEITHFFNTEWAEFKSRVEAQQWSLFPEE